MTAILLKTFLDTTTKYFAFLEKSFNFTCIQKEIVNPRYAVIVYRRGDIEININFNSYSFEIEFNINQKIPNARKFSLGELIRFYRAEEDIGFLAPQASTPESLTKIIKIIANFLENNASQLLFGKSEVFQKLLEFVKKPALRKLP